MGKIICNGQLRYVKYAYFLVKLPVHDRLAAMEALVMDRIIQCDTNKRANAIEQLKRNCADTSSELSKEWEGIVYKSLFEGRGNRKTCMGRNMPCYRFLIQSKIYQEQA